MSTVWVLGAINIDLAVWTARHPAPGETVLGSALRRSPGGKAANQALAARRAGIATALVGRVGKDRFGDELLAFLGAEGVELRHVEAVADAPTGVALIVVAAGENTIVVALGAGSLLDERAAEDIELSADDVVLVQLETPPAASEAILMRARKAGARTVLNVAPARAQLEDLLELADVVVLNEGELATVTQYSATAPGGASAAAHALKRTQQQTVVVTLGAAGALAASPHGDVAVPGREVGVLDSTGAGDCFAGYLAATLAFKAPIARALRVANCAASLSVQRPGAAASMPRAAEVAEELRRSGQA